MRLSFPAFLVCIGCIRILLKPIQAYPTGPGSCNSPKPIGGPHGFDSFQNSLSSIGGEVRINGSLLTPGSSFDISSGESYTLELLSSQTQFRGFLIKLYKVGANTSGMLSTSDPDSGRSFFCSLVNAAGIGHVSKDWKSRAFASLQASHASMGITLEVTVVVDMGAAFFSSYTINSVAVPSPPTQQPTTSPTPEPSSLAPTRQPTVESTTLIPTRSPTPEPSSFAPTRQPTVKSTTLIPTRSPTARPPSLAPTRQPTRASTTLIPTKAPQTVVTQSPTRAPTTRGPTRAPTAQQPTHKPSRQPTTRGPTRRPTRQSTSGGPTRKPTSRGPTRKPTSRGPTRKPTSRGPTRKPSLQV